MSSGNNYTICFDCVCAIKVKRYAMCTVLPCGVLAALCVILVATGIDSGALKI